MRIAICFSVLFLISSCGGELEIKTNSEDNKEMNNGTDVASNCGVDERICGGTCTDIRANKKHCGGCGMACATGFCVDFQCTGNQNNGAVNNVANNGTSGGNNGSTAPNCEFELCNNVCINTTDDPDYCGSCTTSCNASQVCQNSAS